MKWMGTHATHLIAAGLLAAMFITGAVRYEHFANLHTVVGLFSETAFIGIAAVGATLVIASGGIDLSVGANIACSGVVVASLVAAGVHPLAAMAIATGCGTLLGGLIGYLIDRFELAPFMVTLCAMFAIRATGFLVHEQSLSIDHPFFEALRQAGVRINDELVPLRAIELVAALLAGAWLLNLTPVGKNLLAIGGNARAALVMGVPMRRTRMTVYALSGMCGSLAGCVLAMYKEAGDPAGNMGLELDVIATVVVGGTLLSGGRASMLGTLLGVLTLATLRTLIDFEGSLPPAWTSIATGLLLLVMVQTQRMFARRGRG